MKTIMINPDKKISILFICSVFMICLSVTSFASDYNGQNSSQKNRQKRIKLFNLSSIPPDTILPIKKNKFDSIQVQNDSILINENENTNLNTNKRFGSKIKQFFCKLRAPLDIVLGRKGMKDLLKFPESQNAFVQLFLTIFWVIFFIPMLIVYFIIYLFSLITLLLYILFFSLAAFIIIVGILAILGIALNPFHLLIASLMSFLVGLISYLIAINLC